MKYRPKLDPKVDLKGATPEALARALFRPSVGRRTTTTAVVGGKVRVKKIPADKAGDGIPHLGEGV